MAQTATTTTTTAQAHTTASSSPTCKSVLLDVLFGPGGAATIAGSCEILIFHPFDTTSKRLMAHKQRVVDRTSLRATLTNIDRVIFGGLYDSVAHGAPTPASVGAAAHHDTSSQSRRGAGVTLLQRVQHMYPGSAYAVAYKVLQRVVKFAGQPYTRDYLACHYSSWFGIAGTPHQSRLSTSSSATTPAVATAAASLTTPPPMLPDPTHPQRSQALGAMALEATAGAVVGVLELSLLPFDRMKVLNQTNKATLQQRGLLGVLRTEGITQLYAGALTTGVRNVVGSVCLFGGTALAKDVLFHLDDYRKATFVQNVVASSVGSCIGVLVTSPIDVVKTRVQSQHLGDKVSGWRIFAGTVRTEGFGAFYKGITPKLITTAPRLVFSYTLTQQLTKRLRRHAQ